MSNTISTAWENNYLPFNAAMLVMLLSVLILYGIQAHDQEVDAAAAKNSIKILGIVCGEYLVGFLFIVLGFSELVIWIDIIAVLTGAFLPFVIRGDFEASIISFPHLVERFELLTIITFGECVVGMTGYFDIVHFTLLPILLFTVIITMFGSYVVQIHYLMNHDQVQRALPLMFSHYFIVIAVNLVTVGIHMLHASETISIWTAFLLAISEITFYYAMMKNRIYYREGIQITSKEAMLMGIINVIGALIILIGHVSIYMNLAGMLLISGSGFLFLINKQLHAKEKLR